MYQTNILFNFFKKVDRTNLSSQEVYHLFKLYNTSNPGVGYRQFCVYVTLYLANFQNLQKSFLVLNLLFCTKIVSPLKVTSVFNSYQTQQSCNLLFTFHSNPSAVYDNLTIFWKKFKKLKRPKTEENFSEFYLKTYLAKLTTYSKLNLLVLSDSFYIVRGKTETLVNRLVTFNKPLLVAPKLSSSSINKFIDISNSKNLEFQFLRKNKVYNKGRYSRCRQNYRTGVYMCLYLSVVSIFGLYYWFYKFSFNFTYLWWLFIAFVGSFFLPKIIKYRLYEPVTLINKFFDFFRWLLLVIKSLFF
jgi:hypothetical protein